ncbi:MAG: TonB-dependent receptor [Prevotellaceae bacterium]|nr:TonB-dependent receptor [Prevotellaceae bacterium]
MESSSRFDWIEQIKKNKNKAMEMKKKCDKNKKHCSLVRKLLLLFCGALASLTSINAQTGTVTGSVTDATGEPLTGVSVHVKGTTVAAVTDIDGIYTITAQPTDVLEFSFIGMKPQQVTVGASGRIDVVMEDNAVLLEEAVVVGYGTQKAKDLTAPIVVIKGAELSKQSTTNAAQALQGKVAGVQVINGGAPGAGATVKIRGVGSISDYAKPLYIVDGTFVENIDFLSSTDIETTSILKDASASAIYGVRAANGVIIITTKKGFTGKPSISYDGYAGVQIPVNIVPLANKEQYIELLNRANETTTGYTPRKAGDYAADTDWYRELVRSALMQSHSLDVSGATETANYSAGLNYFEQDGIMDVDNRYVRYNLRARFEQEVAQWLKIGATSIVSDYNKQIANETAWNQAYLNPPLYPVYNEANTAAYPEPFDAPQRYGYSNSYGNPVAAAYYRNNKEKGKKLIYSLFAEFNIIDGKLTFKTSYNQDYTSLQRKNYQPESFVGGSQGTKQSNLTETFEHRSMQIIDNILTYTDRKGLHNYTLLVGQSARMERMSSLWGSAVDVPGIDDQSIYLKTGSYKNRNTDDDGYAYNGLSAFLRGTYNYNNRYLLSLTFRADASSKYQEKWGYFPSIGLGWALSEEHFMKSLKAVDYLKLRASWGMLGNDNVPANSAVTLGQRSVATSTVFNDALVDGVGAQTVLQNYLKWEVVSEFNIGFDLSALGNRLSAEADFYHRTTDNVVFYAPIASGGGTTELLANNGKVRNAGVELTLGWNDNITRKLSYHVSLNATTIHNEVLELNGREFIPGGAVNSNFATRTAVGHPIGAFYGYRVTGVLQSKKDVINETLYGVQPLTGEPGYFKYEDANHDGKITDDDKMYLGSPTPWLIGGVDMGLNYGAWDFGITFYGQLGNKILNAKRMNRGTFSDGNYDADFYENAWNGEGSSNTYPSPAAYNSSAVQQTSSFFVEDGSYFRIQNLQLGYTLKNIKRIPSLRIYLSAQRPLTIFGYNGFTPEVSGSPIATGIDNNVYPMQAIYSVGLKMNF